MEYQLGARVPEHPSCLVHGCEVVVGAPGDDNVVCVSLEPRHEVRAEEASAAGDQHAHRGRVARDSASAGGTTMAA